MKRASAVACLALAALARGAEFEAGFVKPPPEARPLAWWHWINGNVTKAGIEADLADMKRVGLAGAQLFDVSIYLPSGQVRYGTAAWHEHVQHAIRTADRLGLELDVMNAPGWSGSGGPWIAPERGMKRYVWSEAQADGGGEVSVALPQPKAKLDFYRDVAVFAVPRTAGASAEQAPSLKGIAPVALSAGAQAARTNEVLVLPGGLDAEGRMRCALPPGSWTVVRFGYTATGSKNHPAQPEGGGLECDKMDAETVAFQFEQSVGRIVREAGPLAGKALRGLLFDSFEGGYQNWTASMPQQFRALTGYDLLPWLPVLTGRTVHSRETSEAFLRDFRSAVARSIAENYYGTMRRLARERGLLIYAEAQGGPVDPVFSGAQVDVPMNEFWMPSATPRAGSIKMVASAAKAAGRTVVAAEAFTAKPEDDGMRVTLAQLKRPGDEAFAAGVNRFILHDYAHQPYDDVAPGFTLGRYGTHFGRLNTWWPYADEWVRYVARCQYLLQQGQTVADVCCLINEDLGYAFMARQPAPPAGFDFDVIYPAQLEAAAKEPAYRLLAVPDEAWAAGVETLRTLLGLVRGGRALAGEPPAAPFGVRDCEERAAFEQLSNELWGGLDGKAVTRKAVGAGTVCRGLTWEAALRELKVARDVEWPEEVGLRRFVYTHRRAGAADIYFVLNDSSNAVSTTLTLRAAGRTPEFWDAMDGARRVAPAWRALPDGRVALPLKLAPWGSTLVVFGEAGAARRESRAAGPDAPQPGVLQTVDGPWEVSFDPQRGGPGSEAAGGQRSEVGKTGTVVFASLTDWKDHPDPGIKYYSGTAVYRKTVTLSGLRPPTSGSHVILDLGKVCDVAEVWLNGEKAGVRWTPPFRVDVSRWVRPGENALEIRVANTWVNRLIGDERIPVAYAYRSAGSKFTLGALEALPEWLGKPGGARENKRRTFITWKHYTAESPLLEAGLMGPIRVIAGDSAP